MNYKNYYCSVCGSNWDEYGTQWKGSTGAYFRCKKCLSKRKPVHKKDIDSFSMLFESLKRVKEKRINTKQPENSFKKILVISDLHCGSRSGLTPPNWLSSLSDSKRRQTQQETWDWFVEIINEIGEVDCLVVNGDCIDGKGTKSGGTELITSDLFKQIEIAKKCINHIDFNNIFFTYGTNYHCSSNGDDFEVSLAKYYSTQIKDHLWLDVNGCIFDFKHKIQSSSVFNGRGTALLKEVQWNREWSEFGDTPKSNVLVRSHVHYCSSVSDYSSYLAMTTPALQVANTKFGGRECSGTIDFGCILFTVPEDYKNVNDINVRVFTKNFETMKSKSIKI